MARSDSSAQVVLPARDFKATLDFFTERLGFQVHSIFPADDPRRAVIQGHGCTLQLRRDASESLQPGALELVCADPRAVAEEDRLLAPNGTNITLVRAEDDAVSVACSPSLCISAGGQFAEGRAGMLYRDLVPGRQGGFAIASHIRIEQGGPVPDYVHYHRVQLQLIYCLRGRVRVVYEDQGEPFDLQPGDCVLQPPTIRHRVLECSDGLEVVEVSVPAEHITLADPGCPLPTGCVRPDRVFGGQRFVRHVAGEAEYKAFRWSQFEARDLGIQKASGGVGGAVVARRIGAAAADTDVERHDCDLRFTFVIGGSARLFYGAELDQVSELQRGGAFVIPAGTPYQLRACTSDLEFLEVSVPKQHAQEEQRGQKRGLES